MRLEKITKEIKQNAGLVLIMLVLITLMILMPKAQSPSILENNYSKKISAEWKTMYEEQATIELGYDYYSDISNTEYYDYNHPSIVSVAESIASESNNVDEAIDKTLKFVYANVKYDRNEPDSACFEGTAPSILSSGVGQCDTQSILVISILRRMGIAAKPVGGCLVRDPSPFCGLQSLFTREPLTLRLTDEDLEQDVFSRRGGLHAWVTVWTPDGWVELEPTTGKRADTNCFKYHVELFPRDDQKRLICVSTNYNYAASCRDRDLNALNRFGLGLAEEVQP